MFNADEEVENIVNFVRDYFKEHGLGGAVLGVSGGKDSAVVLALLAKALDSQNVVGLTLPCHSGEEDKNLAKVVADHFGVKLYNVELSAAFDEMNRAVFDSLGESDESNLSNSKINLKPRLRTATLYYVAAMLSSARQKPYIVAGTGNKCELYVGYFTKGGDNICDISLLADFDVSEVIGLGEVLGVPPQVLYRTPSDGISGFSDEEKLGVTYADISSFMKDKNSVAKEVADKIERLHSGAWHKFNLPTYRRKQ